MHSCIIQWHAIYEYAYVCTYIAFSVQFNTFLLTNEHLKPGLIGASYLLLGLNTWVHILIATKAQDYKWLMQRVVSFYNALILKNNVIRIVNKKSSSKFPPDA